MPSQLDLSSVVRAAESRGYFDLDLLKGSRCRPDQLLALYRVLDSKRIPREAPEHRLDRSDALAVINALRTGTVPNRGLNVFSVGRSALRQRLRADLDLAASGGAQVRFLNASHGAGKTHTLSLLAEAAFENDFAVSLVTLSRSSCPLYSLQTVYGAITGHIRTAKARTEQGLENLLGRWIDVIERDGRTVAERRIAELPRDLVTALSEYAGAVCNPVRRNYERAEMVLRYLGGGRCLPHELRQLGVERRIDDDTALETLKDITVLVRHLGFRGLCVFLDEAEVGLSYGRQQLMGQAYTNLYRIIDAGPRLRNCYFIYAATPSFFEDYHDYWPDTAALDESHVYQLRPLSDDEYLELADRILIVYEKAYACDVPRDQVRSLVPLLVAEHEQVGGFVRGIVAICDRVRADG